MKHKQLLKAVLVLALVLGLLPWSSHPAQAATYTVNSTNDVDDTKCNSFHCSLREAINAANANPGLDTIGFNIPASDPNCSTLTKVCTITPASALPTLTDNDTHIDGYTQGDASPATATTPAVLRIEINGTSAGGSASGLTIESANNSIRGLVINNFEGHGVFISGTIATNNTVLGNYIGTNFKGTDDLGNDFDGVNISWGAQNNTIGGSTPAARNVISGNDGDGVRIEFDGTTGNTVSGNTIGLTASGTAKLGNDVGVFIGWGAQNNTIGGNTAGERNVISGNDQDGVFISENDTTGNVVSGNYIGTDKNGTADLGNGRNGVYIGYGAQNNTIGGDTDGERNVISGNDENGVYIYFNDTTNNTVSGNYIGTDKNGTADLGNGDDGVYIHSAQNNTVGGDTAGERNVISGNGQTGVVIYGSDAMGNTISGNYIGIDANGTLDRGNAWNGVVIGSGAQNNTVGGDTAGERNVISGNDQTGIYLAGDNVMSNTILGNYIGTDKDGLGDLGNGFFGGVYFDGGVQNNTLGPGNVIAYNGDDGVGVNGAGARGNTITQNSIFSNTMGIDLVSGANGGILPPIIITTTQGSVNIVGTACAGCTVEVFRNGDTDGEGETYIGATTATAGGAFTLTVSSLSQPYLTATATDAISGTSEFSGVFTATVELAPGSGAVYLPIIMRNN
jgi:CSLREA domain-containing protein